jgi:hypothetical protein
LAPKISSVFPHPPALLRSQFLMMKSAGIVFALALATALPATAQISPPPSPEVVKLTTEPVATPKMSAEVSQRLTDQLQKYTPPPPATPAVTAGTPTDSAEPDPNMLQLKKVIVTPRKRPRLTDDVMMTNKAYSDKLAQEKLSSLDRNVLNKFTLPAWFGGVSAAERAREERNRELRAQTATDTVNLAKVVEVNDPEQAKALRDAINRP